MARPVQLKVTLSDEDLGNLQKIARSTAEKHVRVRNAKILIMAYSGSTPTVISEKIGISRQSVHKVIKKFIDHGIEASLDDLPRSGRPSTISDDAKRYVIDLACTKPVSLGYPHELWTISLLRKHVVQNCRDKGFSELEKAARSTIWSILNCRDIKPHKIRYYLERKDEHFEENMNNVLMVYKEVNLSLEQDKEADCYYVSYDEKPGIQALANIADDRGPTAEHGFTERDYEYKRHGTISLLAGIDLITGEVHAIVRDRHRSREFVEFLTQLDEAYPKDKVIKVVLDNHRAHTSKETMAYLKTCEGRFQFIFTPKHGSWLNLIEGWFSKLSRTLLRGIRVKNKEELVSRLMSFIDMVNEEPVAPRWRYKMDEIEL